MRYVVTELEGFATEGGVRPRNNARPGLSVQVLDRLTCHRIVAAWRTEDFHGNYERRRAIVRHRAATHDDLPALEPLDDRYLLTEEE